MNRNTMQENSLSHTQATKKKVGRGKKKKGRANRRSREGVRGAAVSSAFHSPAGFRSEAASAATPRARLPLSFPGKPAPSLLPVPARQEPPPPPPRCSNVSGWPPLSCIAVGARNAQAPARAAVPTRQRQSEVGRGAGDRERGPLTRLRGHVHSVPTRS